MNARLRFFGFFLLLAFAAVEGWSQEPVTAIKAGRLIDVRTGQVLTGQTIIIKGERIVAVGADLRIEPGATVIDLTNATVLPALVGESARETLEYVKWGMTPIQAIQTRTLRAAEQMGWSDRVGTLEPGKFADIIAVEIDPNRDIRGLEYPKFMMKRGQVVAAAPLKEPVSVKGGAPPPLRFEEVEVFADKGWPRSILTRLVKQYGVNFVPTPEQMARLRQAGADDELLSLLVSVKPIVQVSQLSLVTQPGGVQAYVGDTFRGITSEQQGNLNIENLTPGSHQLRLTLPGYKEWNQQVTLPAGETLPVSAKLEPAGPKPLAFEEVEEALRNGISNKRVGELVKQFGVNFSMTAEREQRLRGAGADGELLYLVTQSKK